MTQFKELMTRIEVVNSEQQPLMAEHKKIKGQIDAHASTHSALLTAAQDAAEARVRAQNEKDYYVRKLEEEQAKVDIANEAVAQVQEEFIVSASCIRELLWRHQRAGSVAMDGEGGAVLRAQK